MKQLHLITIVITVIIVTVCATVIITQDDTETSSTVTPPIDKTGHWYLVEEAWLDENNNIQKNSIYDDPNIGMGDLDIFGIDKGLFFGYYLDTNISGAIINNGIPFGLAIGDTEYIAGGVALSDNVMHMSMTSSTTDDGSIVSTSAKYLTFTKDRSYVDLDVNVDSLAGKWTSFDCTSFNGDVTQLGKMELNIVQVENLIHIALDGNDLFGDYVMRGIVSTSNTMSIAPLIDMEGNTWRVTYKDEVLTLNTILTDGTIRDVCLKFTNTGESGTIAPSINLLDTSWRVVSARSMNSDGTTSIPDTPYYLTFDKQSGCNVVGTFHYGDNSTPIYISLVQGSTIIYYLDDVGSTNMVRSGGSITNNQIQIRYSNCNSDGSTTSTTLLFEKIQPILDADLTGTWYLRSSAGFEFNGEYTTYDSENLTSSFDLDIFGITDGVLYGFYSGSPVTGSYVGGILTLSGKNSVDGGDFFLQGWLKDQSTLAINDVYYREVNGKIETSGYTTILSRDRGSVMFEDTNIDIIGNWVVSKAEAYDGVKKDLKYTDLEITDHTHDVFKGSYGRTVDGVDETVTFTGTVSSMSSNDTAYGLIIDDNGSIWYISIDNDILTMKIADKVGIMGDEVVAIKIVYFKEDSETSGADVPRIPNIRGTWKATEMHIMNEDGTYEDNLTDYVLDVSAQDDEFAIGSSMQGEKEKGTFAMMITTNILNEIAIIMASDYDLDEGYGFGWVTTGDKDGTHIYLIETYTDDEGVQSTQLCRFEKVIE